MFTIKHCDEVGKLKGLKKVNILITGPPRSGKSTLIEEIIKELIKKGFTVRGISTPEARERGRRIGFKIIDLATGEWKWMAHINISSPYKVSKYGVDLDAIESIGVKAILSAIESADVIIIDEIGKMELFSEKFKKAVKRALDSSKPVIGTIGLKLHHPFADEIKRRKDVTIVFLTREKWEEVYNQIINMIFQ